MMLVLDVHRAQKTDNIQQFLRSECNTEPVFVPAGTTSLVQPVDVVFNAPFKAAIEEKATAHLQDNLSDYINGKISASDRRILFTKWVGQSWEDLSANQQMITRSFEKCGISVPIDGSNDSAINISGLENYTVDSVTSDDETELHSDPFESLESDEEDIEESVGEDEDEFEDEDANDSDNNNIN